MIGLTTDFLTGRTPLWEFQISGVRTFSHTVSCGGLGRFKKHEGLMMADETSGKTPEQMAARIAELERRLAKGASISFKVSEKGAVLVYGLGRFPVTLYLEQWEALLANVAELREFIESNKSRLKTKDQTKR